MFKVRRENEYINLSIESSSFSDQESNERISKRFLINEVIFEIHVKNYNNSQFVSTFFSFHFQCETLQRFPTIKKSLTKNGITTLFHLLIQFTLSMNSINFSEYTYSYKFSHNFLMEQVSRKPQEIKFKHVEIQ